MRSNDEIIDLVIDLYQNKGWSLSELSRRTSIPKSSLSRYFNKNRKFPINKTHIFAEALNTTSEFLLGLDPTNMIHFTSTLALITETSSKLDEVRQKKVLEYVKMQLEEQENGVIIS